MSSRMDNRVAAAGGFLAAGPSGPAACAVFLAVALAAAPLLAAAQDDLPARELQNGDRLARDGKTEQAAAAWMEILSRHPDSPEAAAALERLGTVAYPVESFAARGTRPEADFEEAQARFSRLASDYRQAAEAPRALLKLGLLLSDPAAPQFDLDEAYARFSALVTIYPDSSLRPLGLLGLGDVLYRQRQYGRALSPLARLDAEFPDHPEADAGLWMQGESLARMARSEAALRTFQDLRDRFPESEFSDPARDRNTHLARLAGLAAGSPYGAPVLVRPGIAEEWRLRSLADLAVDSGHRIALADEKSDAVHLLDLRGRVLGRSEIPRPTAVWMGDGSPLVQSGSGLWRNGRSQELRTADGKPFQGSAGMLSLDSRGRPLIWDRRAGELLRFARSGDLDRVLATARDMRIDDAAVADDDTLAILDSRAGVIRLMGPDAQPRSLALPADGPRRPDRLACDFLGNLFIMDTSNREIAVLDRNGRVLARLVSGKGEEDPFPRPADFTVNSRGGILIYDERRQGIVVFP